MGLFILRAVLLAATGISGYFLLHQSNPFPESGFWGIGIGLIIGVLVIIFERSIRRVPLKVVVGGAIGLVLGLLFASFLINSFLTGYFEDPGVNFSLFALINSALGYVGLILGLKKGREFEPERVPWLAGRSTENGHKVLDTSVIIDGRIADICDTGFLEGTFIIPQFILQELQHIADSSDPLKRGRGRRGLDVLNRIQKQANLEVRIVDQDFPKIQEVDAKLIALAKETNAKIVTNDFNLNKVAELQGIPVLNINQLFNALKPVVLPGEVMNVKILKEGKEPGQGVAYLDDGTMVVVDNARRHMGKSVDVTVTSVLQTTAGRMIFTILKEDAPESYYQNYSH
ncbi:MAG TPA: PIN domain-containing protein [Thermodesulfobacteriota bacterium]|nr:PIN domain-containing protein [Thermodesulfobacteriota bacterium]